MAYRGAKKQDAAAESLEDLLKALEPDTSAGEANLSTSELEDLIANLDEVVETKPAPIVRSAPPPSRIESSNSDGLEDLLRELEHTESPQRTAPPPASKATKKDDDFDSGTYLALGCILVHLFWSQLFSNGVLPTVNSLLDDTLKSLSLDPPKT
jgi:hypothetical protein